MLTSPHGRNDRRSMEGETRLLFTRTLPRIARMPRMNIMFSASISNPRPAIRGQFAFFGCGPVALRKRPNGKGEPYPYVQPIIPKSFTPKYRLFSPLARPCPIVPSQGKSRHFLTPIKLSFLCPCVQPIISVSLTHENRLVSQPPQSCPIKATQALRQ